MLRRAAAIEVEEVRGYGRDKRGDELPAELRRREDRLRKIREAKAALEAEAKARAEAERARHRKEPPGPASRPPKPPRETPPDKAQYNFTDPQSSIVRHAHRAFIQGYNAQAAA